MAAQNAASAAASQQALSQQIAAQLGSTVGAASSPSGSPSGTAKFAHASKMVRMPDPFSAVGQRLSSQLGLVSNSILWHGLELQMLRLSLTFNGLQTTLTMNLTWACIQTRWYLVARKALHFGSSNWI